MSEFIKSISDKLYAYISFHSYSQLLLFPYGHTSEHLENYDEEVSRKQFDIFVAHSRDNYYKYALFVIL